jgi:hypothetical protein
MGSSMSSIDESKMRSRGQIKGTPFKENRFYRSRARPAAPSDAAYGPRYPRLKHGPPEATLQSIATCHAVLSRSDLGRLKICSLASSSVRSVLPSGKTRAAGNFLIECVRQGPTPSNPGLQHIIKKAAFHTDQATLA